jgi:alkylhydroperoxidase family enzyme
VIAGAPLIGARSSLPHRADLCRPDRAGLRPLSLDPCWNEKKRALISACDQLHASCELNDDAWAKLKSHFVDEAILEILMLCGLYLMVAYLTNALRLPLEVFALRFPEGPSATY